MKLRRALTTAAATAVIAPAALLASPVAYADDTPPPVSGEAPADPGTADGTTPDAGAGGATPGEGSEDTDGADNTDDTDNTDDAEAPGTGDEEQNTDGAHSTDDAAPGDESKPGTGAEDDGAPVEEEPADECTVDAADLQVTVTGLPSQLVAGGAWSMFSVHLKNTTDETLDEVFPILYAVPVENIEHPDEALEIQYQDPGTGEWTSFNEWTNGSYFGYFTLDAQQTAELPLRIRADKDAEQGDGFALVAGDYYKQDGSCGWSEEAWYDFTILAAGTEPGEVQPAKPGKPGKGDEPVERPDRTKPQGGLEELPVKGNLARTGSSSMLPTIAVIGGVAMVAGAGAVFVVRRRKAGDLGATA